MTVRPVTMSAPMVLACLREIAKPGSGKTMTRRLPTPTWRKLQPGDLLWARESITRSGAMIQYVADHKTSSHQVWGPLWKQDVRTSIHMPRWASRLTLEVTAVKAEPLNDITDEDALREGITRRAILPDGSWSYHVPGLAHPNLDFPYLSRTTPREMFAALWDCLHGSGAWLGNPEVVAIAFRPHLRNIDDMATPHTPRPNDTLISTSER